MKKIKVSRRDFIKVIPILVGGTTAALAGKEIVKNEFSEAKMDDLEVVEEKAQISCLDMIKSLQQKG